MSSKPLTDLSASVRQRLLSIAKAHGEEFQSVLTRYGVERLLYRLSQVPAGDHFILKGAVLFYAWEGAPHRPTRDVDFLGYGDSTPEAVAAAFRAICAAEVEPDGLRYVSETVIAEPIRDRQAYGGVRVTLLASLGIARIPLQVDIGFGDAVVPAAEITTFPTLLEFPAPRVRMYPAETVIAEKFQAMVALGIANTRMKDFYDVWVLAETHFFDGATLAKAIGATFARRRTDVPRGRPLALSDVFASDAEKRMQWRAFLNRSRISHAPAELRPVIEVISEFVLPPAHAQLHERVHESTWIPGSGWR